MACIKVKITVAWWVRWYISGVSLFAMLTGLEPDMEKVMNRTHAERMHSMRLIHAGCQAALRELIALIQKRPAITRRAVWCVWYDRTMDGIKQ